METLKTLFPELYQIYIVLSKKKNLQNLTYFLLLNLVFMFVEVVYGLLSNSLGLLTDGAHMLLDCTAVIIGLYSSYLSEKKPNENFNFGFYRSEIIGTFINSVFLVFIAIYIIFESIERFISPKEIHSENLILVSFIGLIVNIVGLCFAHDDSHHHHNHNEEVKHNSDNKEKEHHHHHNENLYAIYIHILADTLGSVAVLLSSFLIKYYKLFISDPICSLFISIMIFYSTIPVLKNSCFTLLHIPNEKISKKKNKDEKSIKEIKFDDKRVYIGNFDIWQIKNYYLVGEIKINISGITSEDNNEEYLKNINEINNKVNGIMKEAKINECFIEVI